MIASARAPQSRFYGGLFLVTASTLMLQVIQTRILSVIAWYHLAFFAISMAMFGLTAGAVWVYLRRDRFTAATLSHDLATAAAAFGVTTALCLAAQLTLAPSLTFSVTAIVVWAELAAILAVPFFFSGIVVSLALTRSPYPIGRVYGVDLLGAAAGCLGVLLLISHTDGPSAVLWVGAIAAAAATLFAGAGLGGKPAHPGPFTALLQRRKTILGALVMAAVVNGLTMHGLQPLFIKDYVEQRDGSLLYEGWNSFSRIVATPIPRKEPPRLWGPSPTWTQEERIEQRNLNIDGVTGTTMYRFDGDLDKVGFLKYDVTNLAHFLPGRHTAAIIGVGGGRDVLSARVFGKQAITGVEINPIFVTLLTRTPGFADFAGLGTLENTTLVVDEARSWFARTRRSFDLIQMSLIDTWAATGAGAFTLSENGLYTTEAWTLFLRRLSPEGIFTVSRWYSPEDVDEAGRMISLAVAALLELGVAEPRRHLFVATTGYGIATLVLARSPLSGRDLRVLEETAAAYRYPVLVSPHADPSSAVLRGIASATDRAALRRSIAGLPLDLTPPTDDRPFFFNQLPVGNPVDMLRTLLSLRSQGVQLGNALALMTLLVILLVSVGLVAATIVVPLRPAIREVGRRLVLGGTAYFVLIGLGFMTVEIALLQRMSVFLGHPVYALSIVLFSLILATGAGSLVSDRAPLDSVPKLAGWAALTGGYLVSLPAWLPGLLSALEGAPLAARAGLCVAAIAPAGLLMGFGFPTGMRLVTAVDSRPTPWFWGINGAAGVLAACLAIFISIAFGISVNFVIGAICYLLLIPAAAGIGVRHSHIASEG